MSSKRAVRKAPTKKTAATKAPARKTPAKKTAATKTAARKTPAKKTAATTTTSRKTPAKKTAATKTTSRKTPAKKTAATTTTSRKTPAKKTAEPRRARSPRRAGFQVAGSRVRAGRSMRLELPIAKLTSGTPVLLPITVVHGKKDGPVTWISAAIHGDEICGVEIVRQVLAAVNASTMSGTLIALPVVNVHGFNNKTRYLPDRRDLNRSFPGSVNGSLASRIAALFMKEVVTRSDVGIDLHSGSDMRTNLPQIRCNLDHGPTRSLAEAFGAPIIIDAPLQDGSLRRAAVDQDKIMLLFEGGEAGRFDAAAIAMGTAGILRSLNYLGMSDIESSTAAEPLYSRSTRWTRANRSGIAHLEVSLGELVTAKQQIATIYDPFGKVLSRIRANQGGIVIGQSQAPIVNRGDALAHIAKILTDVPQTGSP